MKFPHRFFSITDGFHRSLVVILIPVYEKRTFILNTSGSNSQTLVYVVHHIFYSNLKFIDSKGPVVVSTNSCLFKVFDAFAIFSYFILFMLFNPLGQELWLDCGIKHVWCYKHSVPLVHNVKSGKTYKRCHVRSNLKNHQSDLVKNPSKSLEAL